MKRARGSAAVVFGTLTCLCVLHPNVAQAIPLFANGQGFNCQQCHSAPPNLNAYGRYILATNFVKGLNSHAQMRENLRDPVSLETALNENNVPNPSLPRIYDDFRFISGGYLGNDVTYYASAPVVSGGFHTKAVDQFWGAYNGFSGGNGSLQIGKLPTPLSAPWVSQSLSLAGYALGALPVGLNPVGIGDNRWGAAYSQIGDKGLVGTAAYLTNTGALERAFNGDAANGGEGQSYVGALQFVGPGSHFTGGIGAMRGAYPLPSGTKDTFAREMALLSYSTSSVYNLNVMALIGSDNNPTDGASGSSGSNGLSYEAIFNPLIWLHANLRYEHTSDGLGAIANRYVTALAFSPMSNIAVTLENASSVGSRPVMSWKVMWAGPWLRTPAGKVVAAAPPEPGASTAARAARTRAAGTLAGAKSSATSIAIGASPQPAASPVSSAPVAAASPVSSAPVAAASPVSSAPMTAASPGPIGAAAASPSPSATVRAGGTATAAGSPPAASPSASSESTSALNTAAAAPSAQDLQADEKIFSANCAMCHGADGKGGMGPSLHGIANGKSLDQTVSFIEKPSGGMPKLYPAKISETQVRQVATYIRTTFH